MGALKLTALDEEDLEVISAHLQDAVMRVGDMTYLPAEKRFAIVLNRFDWENAQASKTEGYQRRRAGVDFGRVLGVRTRNLHRQSDDAILSLLSVGFQVDEPPSGKIILVLAGDGEIELNVECIEGRMRDLGPAWPTQNQPEHIFEDD
jgi:Protein of unknown function (DUF2948)